MEKQRTLLILSLILNFLLVLITAFLMLLQFDVLDLDDRAENPVQEKHEEEQSGNTVALEGGFDIDILKQNYLLPSEVKNTVLSPLSIKIAMSMAAEGAQGETLEEMQTVLGTDDNIKERYQDLIEDSVGNEDITIEIANSLWLRDGLAFKSSFLEIVENYYYAEARNLDFNSPTAKDIINGWVSKQTRDKIPAIVDEIASDDVAFLINAIYFNASWKTPFVEELTAKEDFTLLDGSITQVDLMYLDSNFKYFENKVVQAVKLPYSDDGRYTMTVYLPNEKEDINNFVNDLNKDTLNSWESDFSNMEGLLKLPRFKTEYAIELTESLKNLGIKLPFDVKLADFKNMVEIEGRNVYIDKVMHKTYIDVTEEGTEAAAVTSVGMVGETAMEPEPEERFSMIVNRPFLFKIYDNKYNETLFIGVIVDPTQ
jgi:serpin B